MDFVLLQLTSYLHELHYQVVCAHSSNFGMLHASGNGAKLICIDISVIVIFLQTIVFIHTYVTVLLLSYIINCCTCFLNDFAVLLISHEFKKNVVLGICSTQQWWSGNWLISMQVYSLYISYLKINITCVTISEHCVLSWIYNRTWYLTVTVQGHEILVGEKLVYRGSLTHSSVQTLMTSITAVPYSSCRV